MATWTKFALGDLVEDDDGDVGYIIIASPDDGGNVVWKCTDRFSKLAVEGEYYVTHQDDLKRHKCVPGEKFFVDRVKLAYDSFVKGEIKFTEFCAQLDKLLGSPI